MFAADFRLSRFRDIGFVNVSTRRDLTQQRTPVRTRTLCGFRSGLLVELCVDAFRTRVSAVRLLPALLLIALLSQGKMTEAQVPLESPQDNPAAAIVSETETESGSAELLEAGQMTPDFHIAALHLESVRTDESRMWMDVTVHIMVNHDVGWQRIPLRFEQANIENVEYAGAGEQAPDYASGESEEGLTWLVNGKGKHVLKFRMWVPIRKTIQGSQLLLSLPALPNGFVATGAFEIPNSNAVVQKISNGTVIKVEKKSATTQIEVVAKSRLDIVWSVPSSDANAVAHVSTVIQVSPTSEELVLIADQTIDLQQKAPEVLKVRLPLDFKFEEVSGQGFSSDQIESDEEGWVTVPLKEDVATKFELRWILRRQRGASNGQVVVDGFEVEGATRQDGIVRIDRPVGYQMILRAAESDRIYPMQNSGAGQGTAFEFFRQPFRLVHEAVADVPSYSVVPVYQVGVGREQTDLTVHQFVQVDRGELKSLGMHWEDFERQGWRFDSVTSSNSMLGRVTHSFDTITGNNSLSFERGVSGPARFVLTTTFRRPFRVSQGEGFQMSLPRLNAFTPTPGVVGFETPLDTDLNLSAATMQTLNPVTFEDLLTPLEANWRLPIELKNAAKSAQLYRLLPPQDFRIDASVTYHEMEVRAGTSVEIVDATDDRVLVHQALKLSIQYGELNKIRLRVPKVFVDLDTKYGLQESLKIRLNGQTVPLDFSAETLDIPLAEPTTGTIELQTDYAIPVEQGRQEFDLPILSFADFPFKTAECLVIPFEALEIEKGSEEWTAVKTSARGPLWIAQNPGQDLDDIPVRIGENSSANSQQFIVEQYSLFTDFQFDGSAISELAVKVLTPPSRVILSLPKNSRVRSISVGDVTLDAAKYSVKSSHAEELTIQLPVAVEENRTIEIQYQSQANAPFDYARLQTFQFPTFPASVWVDSTVWEFQLPPGHHLFAFPSMSPEFGWVREGFYWTRKPNSAYLSFRAELPLPAVFRTSDSFYPFRGSGPVQVVRFRAMNRSLILLVGAGFALLLGYLFYRFPGTRNVFALVVFAFVFALASIWFLEPLLLLLQPAVIGVVLALAATLIGNRSRNSQRQVEQQFRKFHGSSQGSHSDLPADMAESTKLYGESHPQSSQLTRKSG